MKELTLNEMEYISGGFNLFGAASGFASFVANSGVGFTSFVLTSGTHLPPSSATARWRLVPS
jgi:hypothetical protein